MRGDLEDLVSVGGIMLPSKGYPRLILQHNLTRDGPPLKLEFETRIAPALCWLQLR